MAPLIGESTANEKPNQRVLTGKPKQRSKGNIAQSVKLLLSPALATIPMDSVQQMH